MIRCMPTTLLDPPGIDRRFIAVYDCWPDDLRLLLGPDAAGMLAEFFVRSGGVVTAHCVKQVGHRPRRSTTVRIGPTSNGRPVDGPTKR